MKPKQYLERRSVFSLSVFDSINNEKLNVIIFMQWNYTRLLIGRLLGTSKKNNLRNLLPLLLLQFNRAINSEASYRQISRTIKIRSLKIATHFISFRIKNIHFVISYILILYTTIRLNNLTRRNVDILRPWGYYHKLFSI